MKKLITKVAKVLVVGVFLAVVGCSTFNQVVVTLTATVDTASKEYAKLYNDGLIPANVDNTVIEAHLRYQHACGVAASALEAYQLSGDPQQYRTAFASAKQAALEFVTLIAPFLTSGNDYVTSVSKATKL